MEVLDNIKSAGGASTKSWEGHPVLLNKISAHSAEDWCKAHYPYERDYWLAKSYPNTYYYIGFKRALEGLIPSIEQSDYQLGYNDGIKLKELITSSGLWKEVS